MSLPMPAADEPLFSLSSPPDGRPTLQVSGPAQILQVIPYLLGFHPEASVVLVALTEKTIVVSARFDLEAPPQLAESLCHSAAGAGADRVIAIFYDDAIAGWPLPHVEYLEALGEIFARYELSGVDALAVGKERWWSYLCQDRPDCCPSEGTPLDEAGVAAAGAVAEGLVALPRRSDLEAELAPDPIGTARVLTSLLELGDALDDRPDLVLRAADWAVVRRFVRRARRGAGRPTPDVAAHVLWALQDRAVRDATVGFLVSRPDPEVSLAWRELVRVAPPFWRAPVATIYALWCFAEGSGARTNIALDLALDADPDYTMAQLLAEAQGGGINPFEFITDVAGECQRVGRRIERKRPPWGRRSAE
ncbi:MAG: DUF4192 domain-containing protein [Actinomycetes bacterium]